MLASAIGGRPLVVRTTTSDVAHTDGTSIVVPEDCDRGQVAKLVALHAGLLAVGSDETSIVRRLVGRPRVTRRYFALESARAHRQLASILPLGLVDAGLQNSVSSSAAQSFSIAIGAAKIAELADVWGEMRPRSLARRRAGAAVAPATTVPRSRAPSGVEQDVDDDDEVEQSFLLKLMTSPLGRDTWASRLFNSLAGMKKKTSVGSGAPTEAVTTRHIHGRRLHGRGVAVGNALYPNAIASGRALADGFSYPEWDEYRSVYRDDWCTVHETSVVRGSTISADQSPLRQPLGRTRLDLQRTRGETIGDDIDLDAVIAARCDIRSGMQPHDHIYTSLRRLRRDLAVLILVDASGSTADPASGSPAAVIDSQISAAIRLARTLDSRGDQVAIYAFNSRGRSDVYLYPVMPFSQRRDNAWRARLGSLEPAGFTRLGAAIRHSVTVLTQRSGASREILLVLSDGLPYDESYEGRYAVADTKRALSEAREHGVGCLCLSVGGSLNSSELESVFGTAAFGQADDLTRFGTRLNGLFNEALFAAERAKRRRLISKEDKTTKLEATA